MSLTLELVYLTQTKKMERVFLFRQKAAVPRFYCVYTVLGVYSRPDICKDPIHSFTFQQLLEITSNIVQVR